MLLHRPDIIVLDEATSALDAEGQDRMMELLNERTAGRDDHQRCLHRAELEAFLPWEDHAWATPRASAELVSDIELDPRPRRTPALRWARQGCADVAAPPPKRSGLMCRGLLVGCCRPARGV